MTTLKRLKTWYDTEYADGWVVGFFWGVAALATGLAIAPLIRG